MFDRSCSLTDGSEREGQVVPETLNTAARPPTLLSVADDSDDDVTPSARSRSPSSDVENILDALRDSTVTYFGDFTLRRVFSLEEELVSPRGATSVSAAEQRKPRTSLAQAGDGGRRQPSQTSWTLPLARRLTPTNAGKTVSDAFRRFNGITQERTTLNDDDCPRMSNNVVVSTIASTMMPGCPANKVDYLSTSSPRLDSALLTSASAEKELARARALPLGRLDTGKTDASATGGVASADDANKRSAEQTHNGRMNVETDGTRSVTTSLGFELSGTPCGSEIVDGPPTAAPGACGRPRKIDVTTRLPPVQRSSSNRDASRPPIQPRSSSPGSGRWRRSATPCTASADFPGLTTVDVSRTSSCEVLVDDDDSRLGDVISRVTRRSSCASSAADDADSTAASETDSSAAFSFDSDDLVGNSLLDRLLMRLRSTPRDSPSSCRRRPSTQTSISWSSSDEEVGPHHPAVDLTARYMLPSWINRKHCSLLSSLDDVTSDSDFELGSSLSQLMLTSGKSPHHPSPLRNHDRLSSAAVSCGDLSRPSGNQLHNCRDCDRQPRPTVDTDTALYGELVNSATTRLSAPITESQPAQIHVARTSRIPKN